MTSSRGRATQTIRIRVWLAAMVAVLFATPVPSFARQNPALAISTPVMVPW